MLSRLGAGEHECAIQADVLTEADLRGHHSHGVQRLPVLAARIRKRLIRVGVTPECAWTADSVLSVDGKDGLGPFVAEVALEQAKAALKQRGIVAVAIRNSSHLGMIGYYCEKRASEGFVCIAMTESEALVPQNPGDLDGTMTTAAQPLSEADIENLSHYMAALPPVPAPPR